MEPSIADKWLNVSLLEHIGHPQVYLDSFTHIVCRLILGRKTPQNGPNEPLAGLATYRCFKLGPTGRETWQF